MLRTTGRPAPSTGSYLERHYVVTKGYYELVGGWHYMVLRGCWQVHLQCHGLGTRINKWDLSAKKVPKLTRCC
jgi:hypothetical protein